MAQSSASMEQHQGRTTPRSSSRPKRSTTNLANLRLAPLSTKFTEDQPVNYTTAKSPYEEHNDFAFARNHSSYLQGRSAPSTPGILSRSSSRKHLGGGLSRRGSLYEDETPPYHYAGAAQAPTDQARTAVGSGQIPKAKSDAALLSPQRLSGYGVPLKRKQYMRSRTGTSTPTGRRTGNGTTEHDDDNDDWLTRTRASTHALLQEAKGQSWLATRDSSTSLARLDSDADDLDDDEGYEEMAAASSSSNAATASQQQQPNRLRIDPPSPAAMRVRSPVWGSRYGSRSGSKRTSRRGSTTAFHTPMAGPATLAGAESYFGGDGEEESFGEQMEPDFVDLPPQAQRKGGEQGVGAADETELARLTSEKSFGLGRLVDQIMGFHLFKVEEGQESTDDDDGNEMDERKERDELTDAASRVAAEAKRRREEKERLTALPPAPRDVGDEGGQGGWQDAAWLLSVASKALF
ncbi:hypothetical protein KC332_g15431 [Hortaea werneckii]|uniref:Uncharacterized protein n=2 Tax=Hortaea werneckii TaxID=91943 RepID=A0A3M7IDF5_HORWE|nr:hypothetical protein KC358_g15401 [Hortaea werneckii]OTA22334.1 hypothetical protein BTJ68_14438 [Hortaea werneckii EXF-2000]KAI6803465.1 hypothetical protein KC350_g15206 [Hortaea werneckii]KAI6904285.1 hypothetical protein KC348_g15382 [Hortaea werneckii]KAI6923027.1 hypothetical protein KC341_g15015 [Hortaea werneckii]